MSGLDDTLQVAPPSAKRSARLKRASPAKRAPAPRPRRSDGFLILAVLLTWIAIGIAAASLWPIYQTGRYVVLVAVAVLLGTAIAGVGARFRWPSWALIATGFAVFLLTGVPLAVPDEAISGVLPSVNGLADLLSGIALGWKQLLTIALPVGDYQALLVPALLLVLAVTIVSISVALRAKWGELSVIPPVVLFLVGIVFAASARLK